MKNSTNAPSRLAALGEFIALDFETTGLDAATDTVIDIGAVRYRDGLEVERFATLVNPGRLLSPEIMQLTGITNEELATAPLLGEVDSRLFAFLGNTPIMAHNAAFERSYLQKMFGEDFEPPMMDSCHVLALCYPLAPTLSLEAFIRNFGLRDYEHHRGLQDALDMVEVLRHLDTELNKPEFAELCAIVEYWFEKADHWLWKPLFTGRGENIHHGDLPPMRNFKEIFAKLERTTLDSSLAQAPNRLKEAAFFQKAYDRYQLREAQQKFAAKAAQTLNDGGVYVAEAGTGTGKTLGYLTATLAALAVDADSPVVISTHTKALQNQFLEQELPRLRQLFELPDLRAVVLKGMNNYTCIRKINEALPLFESFMYADNPDECFAGAFLTHWMLATSEGEIEELPRPLFGDFPVIQKVSSEARADFRDCTRHECSFFEKCFYFKKQWEAASAHILAVNHSLLLTYPKSYPEFNRLVVDEADEIVAEAVEAFSNIASHSMMTDVHRHLSGSDGLFENAMSEIRLIARNINASKGSSNLDLPEQSTIASLLERFLMALGRLNMTMSGVRADDLFTVQATLREDRFSASARQIIVGETENLKVLAAELANLAERVIKSASKAGAVPNEVPAVRELQHRMEDLAGIVQTLTLFLDQREEESALYVRIEKQDWSIVATPFNIGERFATEILEPKYAAVFTSATISNTRDMSDFLRGIGSHVLTEHKTSTSRFLSPFNYRANSRIIFLKNFVANNHPDFARMSAEFIANAAEHLGGRTLVLFTSKDRQRKVHDALFPLLRKRSIELMSHGITHFSQHKAIEHFKMSEAAVLMGARGLWKGVDIPGDDLQCLILEKMPYAVPNPFTRGLQENLVKKYEAEAIKRGEYPDLKKFAGYAWNDVDKPQMFQAFRQMFGRLIRTETDKGIMFVLDSQLFNNNLSSRHKQLLELLPDVPYGVASPEAALREIDVVIS
ncbi:MAG: helicase C-terminal domain-containing protein [Candidatus Kapaibacteriota bacterium]